MQCYCKGWPSKVYNKASGICQRVFKIRRVILLHWSQWSICYWLPQDQDFTDSLGLLNWILSRIKYQETSLSLSFNSLSNVQPINVLHIIQWSICIMWSCMSAYELVQKKVLGERIAAFVKDISHCCYKQKEGEIKHKWRILCSLSFPFWSRLSSTTSYHQDKRIKVLWWCFLW